MNTRGDFAQRIVDPTSFDSVDVKIVPIIFIPGVMGSRLLIAGGNNWDPDNQLPFASWAVASLQTRLRDLSVISRPKVEILRSLSSLAKKDIAANKALQKIAASLNGFAVGVYEDRGWAGVLWGFYGTILSTLEAAFNSENAITNPVHAFGYDFRRSNFDSADNLLTFIAEVLSRYPGASQVILVTHSMGGLVARAAMVRNPGVIGSIRGVVHGAQPAMGAVVAYRRMFTGATTDLDGKGIADRVLARIIGTNPVEYGALQAVLPGPMQLLPNNQYQQASAPAAPWINTLIPLNLADVYAIYSMTVAPGFLLAANSPDVNAALAARIAEASAFMAALGDTGHPNTHVLFSTLRTTDAQVDFTAPAVTEQWVKTPSGDGTVPAISGACLNIAPARVKSRQSFNGLDHSGVYQSATFNDTAVQKVALLLSARS